MTAIELPNQDIFKQYLLTLLQEDTTFKYALIDALFKDSPMAVVKPRKKWTVAQKIAYAKKHSINPDALKGLQELFKDELSAHEIIAMIQK